MKSPTIMHEVAPPGPLKPHCQWVTGQLSCLLDEQTFYCVASTSNDGRSQLLTHAHWQQHADDIGAWNKVAESTSLSALFASSHTWIERRACYHRNDPMETLHMCHRQPGWICVSLMVLLVLLSATVSAVDALVIKNEKQSSQEELEVLVCWTCRDKVDNEACNDWAPNVRCPANNTICKTIHRLSTTSGHSVVVNKFCVHHSHCTHDMIGCLATGIPDEQECVSCCDYAYCNEAVPTNHSVALALSSLPVESGSLPSMHCSSTTLVLLACAALRIFLTDFYVFT
ncbi:hypothetical protein LSAT2_028591 [Lamellibrachia satsuma]|nr:hypothetical protein LSAT2_028591 [Lamellibrachia satsuma]